MVKRLTKRFTSFFLAVVFTAMLLPTIPAMAATSGTCGDNMTWTLDDNGTLTISGTGEMTYWDDSKEVPWYSNIENIKTAVIKNGVTEIGSYAFFGCSGLTSVTIPNSVTSIDYFAFSYCSNLTSVTIPNSVAIINEGAFYGCNSLTSVTIPDSVTSISESAFSCCNGLTSVTIPDSVTSISESAFSCCTGLKSIVVDKNNEYYCSIDGNLFSKDRTEIFQYSIGKTDTSYTIPDSVAIIGSYAFSDCDSLTSVTIPDSVTSIYESAFSNCNGLTSVTIPDSTISIDWYAFHRCSGLTSVTIPASVTSIGYWTFGGCTSLKSIVVDKNNEYYCSVDGNLFNKDKTKLIQYSTGKTDTSYTIPDSVTSISDAFSYSVNLKSVTIPDNVTSIGDSEFSGCTGLTNIYVDKNNKNYCSVDGNLFNKDKTELIQYAIGKTDTSYTIPDSVTEISYSAFSGCESLTSVTIPDGVTKILNFMFSDCTALTSVTIPDGVTFIGYGAFSGCTALTSVTIPDSITEIMWHAFDGCTALTDVYYTGTKARWNAIDIKAQNESLTSATMHYNYIPTVAQIPTVDEYSDKLDIIMTKTGGDVDVELTAKGDTKISSDDIQVFAMTTNGSATMFAPTVDGDKIVYSGNIAGENYRVFVWTKDMVPITSVFCKTE